MKDFIKVGKGVFVNLAKRIGYVPMTIPFGASYSIKQPTPEVIAQMTAAALAQKKLQAGDVTGGADAGLAFDQVQPKDADYIYPLFRALDAGLIEDYWIDFSSAGVLKKSMPLLQGQTIFTNHGRQVGWFGCRDLDVNDWRGAVNQTIWDEKGEQSGGISGINTELKVDWTVDPKLARGLLMTPPAVKAVSVSPYFSWEPSHKELWDTDTFWRNLGQEIEGGIKTPACPDGNIVRMVVQKIFDYREISFVVKGANAGSNNQIRSDEDEELSARLREVLSADYADATDFSDEDLAAMWQRIKAELGTPSSRFKGQNNAGETPALQSEPNKEKKKVKLTAELKKLFGLEAQAGDDVDDSLVLDAAVKKVNAASELATAAEAKVTAIQPFIEAERAEVVRLATLVEGVTGEDQKVILPPIFADAIANADAAKLQSWRQEYQAKVDKKFAPKCQNCGSTEIARRSSVEERTSSQEAPKTRIPKSGL